MNMKKITLFIIAILIAMPIFPCTNLIITKGASKDGSVMVTYAADSHTRYGSLVHYPAMKHKNGSMRTILEWGKGTYLGEIPEAPYTYNVVGNINEHQLLIGESTWGGLEEMRDPQGILDYGSLMYICLQRCTTAREAIKLFVELVDKYGYASSGESISFADPNEAWILEIISKKPEYYQITGHNTRDIKKVNSNRGAVWVAVRIPDGYISAHANCARITTFPQNDPENCIYSPDVISYAREQGLYEGKNVDFSFADTYCPLDYSAMRACESRVWSFFRKHGAEDMDKYIDHITGENPKNRLPLYVLPKESLSVKDVADMMRDHFEDTVLDMRYDIGAGGHELPYRWRPMTVKVDDKEVFNERAIATQQTGFWFVGQCRSWLPDEIGGLLWFGVDDAATSPLTPVYASSTEISEHYSVSNGNMLEYSPTSMFWLQNRIAQFAYLRYNQIAPEIRDTIDVYENQIIAEISSIDKQAYEIFNKLGKKEISKKEKEKVAKLLTEFSINQASILFNKWQKFDHYLLVKYIDGNIKRQDDYGEFIHNGHCDSIPVSPTYGGYSDYFKKAMVNEL